MPVKRPFPPNNFPANPALPFVHPSIVFKNMASLAPLSGNLGAKRAAHLLRRASFNLTKSRVDSLANKTANGAVSQLLAQNPLVNAQPWYVPTATPTAPAVTFCMPYTAALPDSDFIFRPYVMGWWAHEAMVDNAIGHKMELFLHQNGIVNASTFGTQYFYDYLMLLRFYALGNYKKFITKLVTDNTMLLYLNNNSNSAANPNENFAREFFELFTIGKGPLIGPGNYTNYTEDDIVTAARLLTGFRVTYRSNYSTNLDPDTGILRGYAKISSHDKTAKTFSSAFQNTTIQGATTAAGMWTELQQFVDLVFNQTETARNIVRKIYHTFVHKKITAEIETDIIEPLADLLKTGNYEMKPVLKKLFESEHFYAADDATNSHRIGGLIKSPMETAFQALSFFNVAIPDAVTANVTHYRNFIEQGVFVRMLGMGGFPLFQPADVAGYPGYYQQPEFTRAWFNSSTIISRYRLPDMLLNGKRTIGSSPNTSIGIKLDFANWVKTSGICADPGDSDALVRALVKYLFPENVEDDRIIYFRDTIFLNGLPAYDWTDEWNTYKVSGIDTEVKLWLTRLFKALLYSQEYQLF